MDLKRRISIAHYDNWPEPGLYYEAVKNASPRFRDEIFDIYFGKVFRYKYRGQEVYDSYARQHDIAYGNVMGVEASDTQIDNLFRIQREFGIEISLTINQLNIPVEMFYSSDSRVAGAFLDWLGAFYHRGLRNCTLANNHLMRTGLLQRRFPGMKWKNTVNQQVSSAQQVLDYLYLGYDVIQLDRSLNRNIDELKRVKDAVEGYRSKHPGRDVKTSLLVWEDCLPSCPFKREHDDLQIYLRQVNYWDSDLGALTCRRWTDQQGGAMLPRFGANCYWTGVETFAEYAGLVDIFKYSGRLSKFKPQGAGEIRFGWRSMERAGGGFFMSSYGEIVENGLEPLHLWVFAPSCSSEVKTDVTEIKQALAKDVWMKPEARKLELALRNCRNQCYRCHLCERTFGFPDVDSAIEL
ncbi:hypothetical protein [Dehalogenimonas sp. 4OHTPN]|uniref:Uncharacterized protein n=1 Tax=Dehalogenimonas sp. 4OHTPN TaxID=3166643 RepID=A0AAU8GB88_9CHLR